MCTVTFYPRAHGYSLAMNRDERTSRGATPPVSVTANGVQAIYPTDIEGGTWIAVNQHQAAFALLNWNDVVPAASKSRSRGAVILALAEAGSADQSNARLKHLDLRGILPFRLIGVFGETRIIAEWSWDQLSLSQTPHPWRSHHWFSSGLSDKNAARERGAVCQQALAEADAGSQAWLRRLHGTHSAGSAFSVCVHRENVSTVSYSEIHVRDGHAQFNYFAGSPCRMEKFGSSLELSIKPVFLRG